MLTGLLVAAAALALGWTGLVFGLQRRALFPAPGAPTPSPAAGRTDVRAVRLGPDGVEAWFLPPRGRAGPAPALLFTHGNGELIDIWLDPFRAVAAEGIGVLLLEYPGYGRSGGRATQESVVRVAIAGYDFLVEQPEVDPARVVAWGRSLGGAAACALSGARPLAALVLESAFTGVRPLARRFGLFGPLVLDPFENLPAVRAFGGPVLVLHGERDPVVPVAHGRALAAAAPDGELALLPCGHNDCPFAWPRVRAFLTDRKLAP